MSSLTPSSTKNPCPVCGRKKDGDCRIKDNGIVFCHTFADETVGEEQNGYRFVQQNNDGRTGLLKPSEQWEEPTKQTSYYHHPKQWKYQNRNGDDVLVYERAGESKRQFSLTGDSFSMARREAVPYRYHDALQAIEMDRADGVRPTVYVVEVEKCADAI